MPTLAQYRQEISKRLGGFVSGTTDGTSTTSLLYDLTWPVMNNNANDDYYLDYYIYLPSALAVNKARTVKTYSAVAGSIAPDKDWTVAPAAVSYELHSFVEPVTQAAYYINLALQRLLLPVEVSFVPADALRYRFELTGTGPCPWILKKSWVIRTGILLTTQSRENYKPVQLWSKVIQDGDKWYLECGQQSTSSTIYMTVQKPMYQHCRNAGGALQNGLSLDTDTCFAPVDLVTAGALLELWADYENQLEPLSSQRQLQSRKDIAEWYNDRVMHYTENPPSELQDIMIWGPGTSASYGGGYGSGGY